MRPRCGRDTAEMRPRSRPARAVSERLILMHGATSWDDHYRWATCTASSPSADHDRVPRTICQRMHPAHGGSPPCASSDCASLRQSVLDKEKRARPCFFEKRCDDHFRYTFANWTFCSPNLKRSVPLVVAPRATLRNRTRFCATTEDEVHRRCGLPARVCRNVTVRIWADGLRTGQQRSRRVCDYASNATTTDVSGT